MPHYLVHDIVWDTEQEDGSEPDQQDLGLPSDVHLYHLDDLEGIADALSDEHGYTVIGYDFQEIKE